MVMTHKERPILFTGPMVRAILDGRKTQTRRALRHQPLDILPMPNSKAPNQESWVTLETRDPKPHGTVIRCRYGVPGDRLWVRETWAQGIRHKVIYKADFYTEDGFGSEIVDLETGETAPLVWKPSIHMPRSASRLTLEITGVRVERIQEITKDEAKLEGIQGHVENFGPRSNPHMIYPAFPEKEGGFHSAVAAFEALWNSINEKRGLGWAANPWVWVIEFKRIGER